MAEKDSQKQGKAIAKIYQDSTARLLALQKEQNQVLEKFGRALEEFKIGKIKNKIKNI